MRRIVLGITGTYSSYFLGNYLMFNKEYNQMNSGLIKINDEEVDRDILKEVKEKQNNVMNHLPFWNQEGKIMYDASKWKDDAKSFVIVSKKFNTMSIFNNPGIYQVEKSQIVYKSRDVLLITSGMLLGLTGPMWAPSVLVFSGLAGAVTGVFQLYNQYTFLKNQSDQSQMTCPLMENLEKIKSSQVKPSLWNGGTEESK